MEQPTQEEIEFSLSAEDQVVRYLEQCRSRNEEPSSRGLALFMLEDTGEHIIATSGSYVLSRAVADMHAAAVPRATDGKHFYRVIVTRENTGQ